jgi:hypothetical protein
MAMICVFIDFTSFLIIAGASGRDSNLVIAVFAE